MPRIVNGQIIDDNSPATATGGCCGGTVNPGCGPATSTGQHGDVAIDMDSQGDYVPPNTQTAATSTGYQPPNPTRKNNLPPRHVTYPTAQRREEQEEGRTGPTSMSSCCWSGISYRVNICGLPIPLLLLIAIPLILGFAYRYEAGLIAAGVIILSFGLSKIWGSRSTSSGAAYRSLNGAGAAARGGRSGPRVRTIGDLPKPPPRNT